MIPKVCVERQFTFAEFSDVVGIERVGQIVVLVLGKYVCEMVFDDSVVNHVRVEFASSLLSG